MIANNGDKPPPQSRRAKISDLLTHIEGAVTGNDGKATIGDYVRLVQLERGFDEEDKAQPSKLIVTWLEPPETYDPEE
jgi:hypothetical protein